MALSQVLRSHTSSSMSAVPQPPFDNHKFRPRDPSDSRSPCPALNALANHGYM